MEQRPVNNYLRFEKFLDIRRKFYKIAGKYNKEVQEVINIK